MKNKFINKNRLVLLLIFIITLLPLFVCGNKGGNYEKLIYQIDELSKVKFCFFPEIESAVACNLSTRALNSNVFLYLPALICKVITSTGVVIKISLFIGHISTFIGILLCFRSLKIKENNLAIGVLLYMSLPVRIYDVFIVVDYSRSVIISIIPWLLWGIIELNKKRSSVKAALLVIMALMGVGYADVTFFFIALVICIVFFVLKKNLAGLISCFLATAFSIPALWRGILFITTEKMSPLAISLDSIMDKGFSIGELFNVYSFSYGKISVGIGVLAVMVICAYYDLVKGMHIVNNTAKGCIISGVLFLTMTMQYFPWDLIRNIRPIFTKSVALLETPTIFVIVAAVFLITAYVIIRDEMETVINKVEIVVCDLLIYMLCISSLIFNMIG